MINSPRIPAVALLLGLAAPFSLADDGTLAVAWRREIAGDSGHTGLYLTRLRLP